MAELDKPTLDSILDQFTGQKGSTISALKAVQEHFGYISGQSIDAIAVSLDVSRNTVFGIASYYEWFHLEPPAGHVIKYCLGTVCDALGGRRVLAELSKQLGIQIGEESEDGAWSLERLPCFGTCPRGPMMHIDNVSYNNLTAEKVRSITSQFGVPAGESTAAAINGHSEGAEAQP